MGSTRRCVRMRSNAGAGELAVGWGGNQRSFVKRVKSNAHNTGELAESRTPLCVMYASMTLRSERMVNPCATASGEKSSYQCQ